MLTTAGARFKVRPGFWRSATVRGPVPNWFANGVAIGRFVTVHRGLSQFSRRGKRYDANRLDRREKWDCTPCVSNLQCSRGGQYNCRPNDVFSGDCAGLFRFGAATSPSRLGTRTSEWLAIRPDAVAHPRVGLLARQMSILLPALHAKRRAILRRRVACRTIRVGRPIRAPRPTGLAARCHVGVPRRGTVAGRCRRLSSRPPTRHPANAVRNTETAAAPCSLARRPAARTCRASIPHSARLSISACVNGRVQPQPVEGQRMAVGNGKTVGQFVVVQDGPASAGTTHHGRATAGRVLPTVGVRLEVSQRQRWFLPVVEPQRTLPSAAAASSSASSTAMFHAPAAGRIEEMDEG